MKSRTDKSVYLSLLILFIFALSANAGLIEGTVIDFDNGLPIARASLRVEGSGRSILANDDGQYRLHLRPGKYQLKFSHIAHYSERVEIVVSDSSITLDIRLRPSIILLKPIKVYERAYDPAQRIIIEAIRRKEDILAKIKDYTFEAYTKMVLRDTTKDDSSDIIMIAEAQQTYFWQAPDTYKEIITARRQSANLGSAQVLLSVGGVLNLNLNRIEIYEYSIVSPTAKDALDYYNYYLLDTIYIDSKPIFRLEIEPKSETRALFVGTIDIADSTYEVAGINIGFNSAFSMPFIDKLRFSQRFDEFDDNFRMPIEQAIEGIVNISFPGIPIFDFEYISAIHNYRFNEGHPSGTFDEYALEVAIDADDIDSTGWLARQTIPLTSAEIRGYQRLDSIANAPKPIWKKALIGTLGLTALAIGGYDFFHFNRVEGAYVGGAFRKNKILPRLDIDLSSGYAIDRKLWEHDYSFGFTMQKSQQIKLRAGYANKIAHRKMIMTDERFNPTLFSLFYKVDQRDYFHEEGYFVSLRSKLLNKTWLSVKYNDYSQWSDSNHTDYSFFGEDTLHRPNPVISNGQLRSVSIEFRWDSRPRIKNKNEIFAMSVSQYTIVTANIEQASPDIAKSDFHFRRYSLSIQRRQRTLSLGRSSIFLYVGGADGALPPQRYFVVDFGGVGLVSGNKFKTLGEYNFVGNRAAAIYAEHDFGNRIFRVSRLPFVKNLPLSLSVHGGIFWTEFKNHTAQPGDELTLTARRPFREIGFGIGRLPLMNLRVMFSWQLSDYDTEDISFDMRLMF